MGNHGTHELVYQQLCDTMAASTKGSSGESKFLCQIPNAGFSSSCTGPFSAGLTITECKMRGFCQLLYFFRKK